MALKGKQPELVAKKLKMFMYGSAGVGKTTAAISFPNCYLIDTEHGSENPQYLKIIKANNGAIFQSSDFNEIANEVKALLTEKHEYKTLIIDPLTTVYNELVDASALKVGTEFGRHVVDANKQFKRLLSLLLRLNMNLILTSHAKTEYGNNMSVVGTTFDCYKKIDYLFDLVIEIKKIGKKSIGLVKKTRIATFDDLEEFEFGYDVIANKYGRDVMEASVASEVLANRDQIEEMLHLVKVLNVPAEMLEKWFTKASCESFEDMSEEHIVKCIDALNKQISRKEAK